MKKLIGSCLLLAAIAFLECDSTSCHAEMHHPKSYDLPNGQLNSGPYSDIRSPCPLQDI